MKSIKTAIAALLLLGTPALAQVSQLAPGTLLGNATAARAPAAQTTLSSLFDRAISSSQGCFLARNATIWTCLPLLSEPVSVAGGGTINITAKTSALAITGSALTTTLVNLPSVSAQGSIPLRIVDWSTSISGHTITLVANGAETIMHASTWPIYSNSVQATTITLYPSTALSGWYTAP